ncbi:MAG: ArsS family sensor histidine kinase [Campylobacterales bacterium]|nr:ArsS family sensor histidine kinase [Campylobacterales bacterium]
MKKNSILFTVNLTFFISFLLISASFVVLYDVHQKREDFFIHKRGAEISRMFFDEYNDDGITQKLKEDTERFNFSIISDDKEIDTIINSKNLKIKRVQNKRNYNLEYLVFNDKHFVHISSPKINVILQDNTAFTNDINITIIIYIAILGIFLFLYFSIINKLKPLKSLNAMVKNFGNEEFDVEISTSNEDEISKLMNEFGKSAKKLKNIKESRNIFIRNIMHELKTPITKGKFLIHLPATEENSDKMQKVFYRLESLINEFAAIEELISTKKELQIKEYFLEDIIDNSVDILMCSEEEVLKNFENIKLHVDFDIFSIAIKNLLDNSIKYSKDKKVTIKTEGKNIVFENSSDKLLYPLENYFEPFFRGNNVKSNQSFGLGLYIIKHILDAHAMSLKYEYLNGVNRFKVEQ